MRFNGSLLLAACLLAVGCQNLSDLPPAPKAPAPATPERLVQPLDGVVGRVQTINKRLNFVVLDYSLNHLPGLGERLELIHEGTVAGELKVTGPYRNASVVADIVTGSPQVGDLTRPKPSKP